MEKFGNFSFVFVALSVGLQGLHASETCEKLRIYKNSANLHLDWVDGSRLSSYGCSKTEPLSIILHGWNHGSQLDWISKIIEKLVKYRGGCVIFFDYRSCIDNSDYFKTLDMWKTVSNSLTSTLNVIEAEGFNSKDIFLYGYSLGARIVIDAAISFGKQKIGSIDICEMAGIGFDFYSNDPKDAAENIQCIFTSDYASSSTRNQCHQNWLMGNCGTSHPGVDDTHYIFCALTKCPYDVIGSHNMCNEIYISAFENDFIAGNPQSCSEIQIPSNMPQGFKMGYMENRRSSRIQGVFASTTSANYPFN